MSSKRVRMIDVADAAGVSRTAASFILNDRPHTISEETCERVRRIAKQMGYFPNTTAQALATGRTRRIGIVLKDPNSFVNDEGYVGKLFRGITVGAFRRNYNLLLHSAGYPDDQSLRHDILSGSSDGSLLVGCRQDDALAIALLEAKHPCVCLSFHLDHPNCHSVDCDNVEGGRLAARHLIELGHRRMALFYPGDEVSWGRERHRGVLQEMAAAGLPSEGLKLFSWSEAIPLSNDWIEAAADFVCHTSPAATGLICADEAHAAELAAALLRKGLKIPQDVSLISFNSSRLSAQFQPALTSIWQPLQEIGAASVEMLLDLVEKMPATERILRLPMRLDVRQSCGSPHETPVNAEMATAC